MAFCPSGSHPQAKPGYGISVAMSVASVAALLNNVPTAWAVPLAALIGAVNYDLSELCNNDPVAVPAFTADDVVSLINGPLVDIQAYGAALAKFHDLVKAYAWFQFCQCSPGATPAAPAPPAQPTGMPSIDPITQPGIPCVTLSFDDLRNAASGDYTGPQTNIYGTGATSAVLSGNTNAPTGPWTATFTVTWYDVNGAAIASTGFNISAASPGPKSQAVNLPANAAKVIVTEHAAGNTSPLEFKGKLDVYCGGTTPAGPPTTGCCPPDPQLMAQVKSILDYVTLLQRQIAPFAFIDGPIHGSVSGTGSIAVTEPMCGIRIALDPLPSSLGVDLGTPDFHFDVGYVALGDADGWFGERKLTSTVTTWQPRWAGAVTRIGYTLHPGVTGAITELRREP